MNETAPIFLVGAQRSGTTALSAVLSAAVAAHGGCFTMNGKLPYLLRRWWTEADIEAQHLRYDEVMHALTRMPAQGSGVENWLERVRVSLLASTRRAAEGSVASAEDEVRRICAEGYDHLLWGDKYNEYLLDLEWLHGIFPAARWIFLVRRPEDSVSSMLAWQKAKPWNPSAASSASSKWAHWVCQWLRFRERLHPDRRLEIDYSTLCSGKDGGLSEFISLDITEFLKIFRYQTHHDSIVGELCPKAVAVREQLFELKLLKS